MENPGRNAVVVFIAWGESGSLYCEQVFPSQDGQECIPGSVHFDRAAAVICRGVLVFMEAVKTGLSVAGLMCLDTKVKCSGAQCDRQHYFER